MDLPKRKQFGNKFDQNADENCSQRIVFGNVFTLNKINTTVFDAQRVRFERFMRFCKERLFGMDFDLRVGEERALFS